MREKVYEIIDSSNDEMYLPIMVVANMMDAEAFINSATEDEALTESGVNGEEYESITVLERRLGSRSYGKEVLRVNREAAYIDGKDGVCWRTVEPKAKQGR